MAQAVLALSLPVYDAAHIIACRHMLSRGVGAQPAAVPASPARLALAVVTLALLASLMLPFTGLIALVPVRHMKTELLGGIAVDPAGSGMAALVLRNAPVAALMLALLSVALARRNPGLQTGTQAKLKGVACLAAFVWVVFASPVAVPRLNSATTLIAAAWIQLRWRSRLSAAFWSLVYTLGIFFMFSALDVRFSLTPFVNGEIPASEAFQRVTDDITQAMRSAGRSELAEPHLQLALGADYAADHGYRYGWHLSRIPLQWVPRSLWPGKPVPPAEVVTRAVGNTPNVSSPMWLEGFADFGILGALALLGAWGYVSGRSDAALRNCWATGSYHVVGAIGPWLGANSAILLRGSLDAGIYRNGFGMLLLWAAYLYVLSQPCHLPRHHTGVRGPTAPRA